MVAQLQRIPAWLFCCCCQWKLFSTEAQVFAQLRGLQVVVEA